MFAHAHIHADQYVSGRAGAQRRADRMSPQIPRCTAPAHRSSRTQTNGTVNATWQANPLHDCRMNRNNLFNDKKNCSFKSLFDDRQFADRTTRRFAAVIGIGRARRRLASVEFRRRTTHTRLSPKRSLE
ncbi:hypothetical protein QZM52_17215 [Burkholderia metallica]|uniref:Uncharacterized protein n=1 Tax=Burkholderia metallica TaxID=488729 RepID=A0ABT8PD12_9BURK|nr:hypothetical protein [Burkholderia metallica]MDN7933029.1 hypothetical protein [Burkholderia metallica]